MGRRRVAKPETFGDPEVVNRYDVSGLQQTDDLCSTCFADGVIEHQYVETNVAGPFPDGVGQGRVCKRGHLNAAGFKEKSPEELEQEKKDISTRLEHEMRQSEKQERRRQAKKFFEFEMNDAQQAHEEPLRKDVQRVVEVSFVDDIFTSYKRLEKELRQNEDHANRGRLRQYLFEAASNYREAFGLFVTAKVEKEAWETRNQFIFAAMWEQANRVLQREKDSKERNKQITDADVRNMAAAIFGDEWHTQETQRRKVKEMVESLQNLVDAWKMRHRALEVLVQAQ